MISYDIVNEGDKILRIVIEPESIEHDLNPYEMVTVTLSGTSPVFACKEFIDSQGVRSISFWPDKGQVKITFKGKDILELH
jgi:hypothetical protein